MKKAILITGIIWLVGALIGAVAEIVVGISFFMGLSGGGIQTDPNPVLGVANIIVGVYFLIGAVLCLLLILKRNSDMKKTPGIVLGVVAALIGATVPGILFAVDSGYNRQAE